MVPMMRQGIVGSAGLALAVAACGGGGPRMQGNTMQVSTTIGAGSMGEGGSDTGDATADDEVPAAIEAGSGDAGAIWTSPVPALDPTNRTTLRTLEATALPSRIAGWNVHALAATTAARSNAGLTLASTSATLTVPSSTTVRTTGTTTSWLSACPAGHAGEGWVFGRGCSTSWATAGAA